MPKVIQIAVTDAEYSELSKKAAAMGFTISRYVKLQILPNEDFKKWFPELILRVNKLPSGTPFNIRAVMGTDWTIIPKGIKLALGRVFFQHVAAVKVNNVKATEPDGSKTQWYIKE